MSNFLNLKCSTCNEKLSVGPIFTNDDGTGYKCGRCKDVQNSCNKRNWYLEGVAAHTIFSCKYFGCDLKLTWDMTEDHERICMNRTIVCPVQTKSYNLSCVCNGIINVVDIKDHFEKVHPNALSIGAIYYWYNKLSPLVYLMEYNQELFFIIILAQERKMYVGVFSVQKEAQKRQYVATISFDKGNNSQFSFIPMTSISQYNERKYCIECFNSKCKKTYHCPDFTNFFTFNTPYDISWERQTSDIKIEIQIIEESTGRNKLSINADVLRRNLECPICTELMLPPIYQCTVGHVVCKNCKLKINEKCPLCKGSMGAGRCFPLEDLSVSLKLPCTHQKNGCNYEEVLKVLKEHEADCIHS